ncbi:MAG: Ni/Fe hydrogenase subunit alpha [Planctomycetales bacterium]
MSEIVLEVPILTRVEGEGGLTVRLRDGTVESVQLRIYEPPRLFESLLRGRPLENTPDITARICGICPVAYQMSSVHALESALGVTITPEIHELRRLLYCGEWIESHALHMHLLHAPDFFDVASGIELAQKYPDEVKRGLRLKKFGNELLEVLGGRAIHPINVAVGGFHRLPGREQLQALIPDFEWGVQAAADATRWVATLPFPEFQGTYEMVALSHPEEYAMNVGEIRSSTGFHCPVEEYDQHFAERQVPHSTAFQAVRLPAETSYMVGPLSRLSLNRAQLSPTALRLADELQFPAPCTNPFQSIVARGIELVHAFETALGIIKNYERRGPGKIAYEYRNGTGCAATEAPRGLLYHRYEIDSGGKVVTAVIIPPTSQNQRQIEADLKGDLLGEMGRGNTDRERLALRCERLVRTYDPCISCATHFLPVRWEEG